MLALDWQGEAVAVLEELHRVATSVREAVLRNDLAALPVLAQREAELAGRLSRTLEQATVAASNGSDGDGAAVLPGPVRERARAWWVLHRQNRMLLQHAHQTVLALLGLMTGAAQEPAGLYSENGSRWPAAGHGAHRPAAAVDQRV